MRLLTTAEAAHYLRLKERKIYELVAEGAIPCTKVTGKWLFPQHELDHWLASNLVRPKGLGPAEPPPIVGGSHDPLLEWALRESGSGLASLPEGSEAGLVRFETGGLMASALHLHALAADEDANVEALQGRATMRDAVLIGFARREQGILVAPDNPRNITNVVDLLQPKLRLAVRPAGAGAQLLLRALLVRAGRSDTDLATVAPPCPTGADLAQAIRAGRADGGIATRAVAQAAGVGFVPLLWEQFDLVMRQRHFFQEPLQALTAFMRGETFKARAAELGGYDVTGAARVRLVS